ncbi:MAG TPA: hypothetical protein VFG21_04940 [Xanthomonadaceae bacterium]|nr:hypothetical protein [Xanthomonadaceae bacterium]
MSLPPAAMFDADPILAAAPAPPGSTHAQAAPSAVLAGMGPLLRVAETVHPVVQAWPALTPVCAIDRDGPREGLRLGPQGRECVYLLPDSDYLAWEQLASWLRGVPQGRGCGCDAPRRWTLRPVRPRVAMPVLVQAGSGVLRPVPLLSLSAVGVAVARRIARAERARLLG